MHFKTGSWLALGMTLAACGSGNSGTTGAPAMATAGTLAATPAAGGTGQQPSAAGTATTTAAAGTTASADTGDVPCAVAGVLKQHCVRCHGRALKEGAPVSLIESASFHRDAGGLTEGAAVLARVRSNERPMPPQPAARLSEAEIATLESWIGPGAKPTHPGCSVDDTPPSAAAGSGGSGVTIVNGAAGTGAAPVGGGAAPAPTGGEQDWSSFGVDLTNSRNNTGEKMLSVESVKGLKELWTFRGASTTCTPSVVDGVIYLTTWDGKVTAMRLDDGMPVWSTTLPDLIDSSAAVTATQVFVSDDNGSVHALDRATGKLQWSQAVDMHAETHLWSSPVFIPEANLVVVGVASGEEAVMATMHTFRGSVVALEAATGKLKWKFETAPAASSGPGIAVWGTVAVDTKRKAVYVGTGNNYQPPSGELSDSMLAISYETGKLLWSRQFTANDVFTVYAAMGPDFDIGSSANLFSVEGKDFVGIGVKSGIYYALERDTGAVSWMTMVTGGSALGGMISASAHANGMLFVASNQRMGGPTLAAALDAKSGRLVWSHEIQKVTYGGVAHANGVVYVGTTAGTIVALDGAKGTMLWVDQTPENQPIAGSPSVSRGKLLVPWGYSWTLREGVAGSGGLTVYGL